MIGLSATIFTSAQVLYHSETWDLMARRWGKLEKDFLPKTCVFDISKIPDIYDCIKYDVEHNRAVLIHSEAWKVAVQLYTNVKHLADVVIPQEYGMTRAEKLTIAQGICTPLLKKIKADLQRNIEHTEEAEDDMEDSGNRLDGRYATGVSSPGRHVRTRLYFTSESHIHSLLTVLSHGGLVHSEDEQVWIWSQTCRCRSVDTRTILNHILLQWKRALEYVSLVSELNYMTQVKTSSTLESSNHENTLQIVIMLYEDPTKDTTSEERQVFCNLLYAMPYLRIFLHL